MSQGELSTAPILNSDKIKYLKKLLLTTFSGGIKLSDIDNDLQINAFGWFFQIFVYLFFPALIIVFGMIMGSEIVAGCIAGGVCAILNLLIQLYVYKLNKKNNQDMELIFGQELSDNQQILLKLVKPKYKILDILINFFLTFLGAFALGYHMNSVKDEGFHMVLGILTTLTTFYSLVIESPKECFAMIGDNQEFHLYSTLYNRVYYTIFLVILKIIVGNDNAGIINIVMSLLPFIFFFGILGPFFATIFYALEKINFWIMGFQSTVSDLRSFQIFVFNFCSVSILYLMHNGGVDGKIISGLAGILALLLNENPLVVIKNIGKIIEFIIFAAVLFVIPVIDLSIDLGKIFIIISFIFYLILKNLEYLQSCYFLGFLRFMKSQPKNLNYSLQKVLYVLTIIMTQICIGILNVNYLKNNSQSSKFSKFFTMALVFRGYRQSFSDLQLQNIMLMESFILYSNIYDYVIRAPLLCIFNIAIANFLRRGQLWIYGIMQMMQDKKQRVKNAGCFVAMSFTLFLPINLISLSLSSVLDTPFVPFLGVPFLYFFGFPRPKRVWNQLDNVVHDTGESQLYDKFMENFEEKFKEIYQQHQFLYQPGKYFLLRIDKYLATLQVLENSNGSAIIQLRGAESQDPVSCHSHEANAIDEIAKQSFEDRDTCVYQKVNSALLPLNQFNIQGYQQNQIKLTGVVENQEFQEGFRLIYLRLIVYFSQKFLDKGDYHILQDLCKNSSDYVNSQTIQKWYPQEFAQFINLNFSGDVNKQNYVEKSVSSKNNNQERITFQEYQQQKTIQNQQQKQQQQQQQTTKQNNDNDDFLNNMDDLLNDIPSNKNNNNNNNINDIFNTNNNNNQINYKTTNNSSVQKNSPVIKSQSPKQQQQLNVQKSNEFQYNSNNNEQQDVIQELDLDENKNIHVIDTNVVNNNSAYMQNTSNVQSIGERGRRAQRGNTKSINNNNSNNFEQQKSGIDQLVTEIQVQENKNNDDNNNINNNNVSQHQDSQSIFKSQDQNYNYKDLENQNINQDIYDNNQNNSGLYNNNINNNNNLENNNSGNYNYNDNNTNQNYNKPQVQQRQRRHQNDQFHKNTEDNEQYNNQSYQSPKQQQQSPKQNSPKKETKPFQDEGVVDILEDLDDILAPGPPPPPPPPMDDMDFLDNLGGIPQQQYQSRQNNNNQSVQNKDEDFMLKIKEITLLIYMLSTQDYQLNATQLNKKEIYKSYAFQEGLKKSRLFSQNPDKFKSIFEIQKQALRYAVKITLDQYSLMMTAEMSDQELIDAIQENDKESYIGLGSELEWKQASQKNTDSLWNLHYFDSENSLGVFISKYSEIKCNLFQFNEDIINGIWGNLMFELYYVTNDDDERYSIQTHKQFFRNIIIENSEQPLGYSPYYSGPTKVLV